jgi:hypothetical protein
MTSPRINQAVELVAEITAIIAASDLTDKAKITVDYDPDKIPSAARYGCILVGIPTLSSPTYSTLLPKWEVFVIAGTAGNYLESWTRLDSIIEALSLGNLNIATAEPASYPAKNGPAIPAYTLSLNE